MKRSGIAAGEPGCLSWSAFSYLISQNFTTTEPITLSVELEKLKPPGEELLLMIEGERICRDLSGLIPLAVGGVFTLRVPKGMLRHAT
jgi:hypothetical protein